MFSLCARCAIKVCAFLKREVSYGLFVIGLIQGHNTTLGVKGIDHFHSFLVLFD